MYLLVDIGGTKTRVAFSRGDKVDKVSKEDTPEDYEEGVESIVRLASDVAEASNVVKVVVGAAAILDEKKEKLFVSPNNRAWEGKSLKGDLQERFKTPVVLENDSALAGLGEAVFGAGRGYKIVSYLTVSTGIGGVRVVEGRIDANHLGFEPGHQIIDADATIFPGYQPDGAGASIADLEELVSGTGIEGRFGVRAEQLDDEKAWREIHRYLAVGFANTILHWSPEVLIIGGGILNSNHFSLTKIDGHLRELLSVLPTTPKLVEAELGDESGIHGALMLAKTQD
ncbi:MAG: ROK family protein [Candidatus Woesebacteria bacterium]|jgi:glucokinase